MVDCLFQRLNFLHSISKPKSLPLDIPLISHKHLPLLLHVSHSFPEFESGGIPSLLRYTFTLAKHTQTYSFNLQYASIKARCSPKGRFQPDLSTRVLLLHGLNSVKSKPDANLSNTIYTVPGHVVTGLDIQVGLLNSSWQILRQA